VLTLTAARVASCSTFNVHWLAAKFSTRFESGLTYHLSGRLRWPQIWMDPILSSQALPSPAIGVISFELLHNSKGSNLVVHRGRSCRACHCLGRSENTMMVVVNHWALVHRPRLVISQTKALLHRNALNITWVNLAAGSRRQKFCRWMTMFPRCRW